MSIPTGPNAGETAAARPNSALVFLACAALTLGAYLRIEGIDRKSLWLDEVWTVDDVSVSTVEDLIRNLEDSPQAPLYYSSLWGWVRIWGPGDISIRSLSTVFGLLALPVAYLSWRGLLSTRAMLWVLTLLALNSYQIAYSQDAKMYAMIWILAIASSGCFLNAVLRPSRPAPWLVAYGLATACLPLVSYVGIAPLAVQGLYGVLLMVLRPRARLRVLEAAMAALIGLFPALLYIPIAMSAASGRVGIDWIPDLSWDQIPWELYRFLGALLLGYRPSDEEATGPWGTLFWAVYGPCVVAALLLVTASALRSLRRFRAERDEPGAATDPIPRRWPGDSTRWEVVAYLALWLVAPVAGALAYSLTVYSLWGVPRYLFGAAPALILWVGEALGDLRRQRLALALGGSLVAVNLAVVLFGQSHDTRIPWRAMARTIEDVALTTDALGTASGRSKTAKRDAAIEFNLVSIGKHGFDQRCLAYPLNHPPSGPPRVRPAFPPLDVALRGHEPFLVVLIVYMGPTEPGAMRRDVERATPGYDRRQVFLQAAYQEPFTSMPSPFMRHTVEIWLCTPRSPSAMEKPGREATGPGRSV